MREVRLARLAGGVLLCVLALALGACDGKKAPEKAPEKAPAAKAPAKKTAAKAPAKAAAKEAPAGAVKPAEKDGMFAVLARFDAKTEYVFERQDDVWVYYPPALVTKKDMKERKGTKVDDLCGKRPNGELLADDGVFIETKVLRAEGGEVKVKVHATYDGTGKAGVSAGTIKLVKGQLACFHNDNR